MDFRGAHNKMEIKQPMMLKSATNKKLPEAELQIGSTHKVQTSKVNIRTFELERHRMPPP
ncbi:hypothetical protein DYY65_07495 [Nitrososphaera sp. AFS]|jgi:hypothetical protein|nr:hypothetical protein [Nitrososphaera sp. AFS]